MLEMFKSNFNMFLDFPGSCGQNKSKAWEKKLTIKMWSQIFADVASFVYITQMYFFCTFYRKYLQHFLPPKLATLLLVICSALLIVLITRRSRNVFTS